MIRDRHTWLRTPYEAVMGLLRAYLMEPYLLGTGLFCCGVPECIGYTYWAVDPLNRHIVACMTVLKRMIVVLQ